MEHTIDEIYRGAQERGSPIGVYTAKEMLKDNEDGARGFFVDVNIPNWVN